MYAKQTFKGLTLIITGLLWLPACQAAEAAPQAVTDALARLLPSTKPDHIIPAPAAGLYEARFGTELFYVTGDGGYLIRGDIFDVEKRQNLTESKRESVRTEMLAGVPEEEQIIYRAEDKQHSVTVFTDIDCPYCVKFHRQIPQLTEAGVEVRYLAFPRAGIDSKSYHKYVNVWCAEDNAEAMTNAKTGTPPPAKTCDNPVQKQYELGISMGVTGTPLLILDSGKKVPGYMPANRLLQVLSGQGS